MLADTFHKLPCAQPGICYLALATIEILLAKNYSYFWPKMVSEAISEHLICPGVACPQVPLAATCLRPQEFCVGMLPSLRN